MVTGIASEVGDHSLHRKSKKADSHHQGTLIPSADEIAGFTVLDKLAWVLVVEKEVFPFSYLMSWNSG